MEIPIFFKVLAVIAILAGSVFFGILLFNGISEPATPYDGEDGYYTETMLFSLQFDQPTTFSLQVPAMLVDGEVVNGTQTMVNEYKSSSDFDTFELVTINSSRYLNISGTIQQFNYSTTTELPPLPNDAIGYEDRLDNYQFSHDGMIITMLEADRNLTLSYTMEADTNYCNLDAFGLPTGGNDIQPGVTKLVPSTHAPITCA